MSESINEDSGGSGNIEGEASVAIDNVAVENSAKGSTDSNSDKNCSNDTTNEDTGSAPDIVAISSPPTSEDLPPSNTATEDDEIMIPLEDEGDTNNTDSENIEEKIANDLKITDSNNDISMNGVKEEEGTATSPSKLTAENISKLNATETEDEKKNLQLDVKKALQKDTKKQQKSKTLEKEKNAKIDDKSAVSSNDKGLEVVNEEEKGEEKKDTTTTNSSSSEPVPRTDSSDRLNEAERQAAIAAAISANPNSMSPSVAAGMAKILALPGIMSDKVNEMSDMVMDGMAVSTQTSGAQSSSSGSPTNKGGSYPPPPPPRGPTMVTLPPPSPLLGSPQRLPMRPVRFEDVKIAFHKLLDESEKRKGSTITDNKIETITGEDSNDDAAGAKDSTSPQDDGKGKEEGDSSEDAVTEENETITTAAITPSATPPSSPDKSSSKGEEVANTQTRTTIPDSFLRFLLLMARVPIIVEEHRKSPAQMAILVGDSPAAAISAAKRAFEILCMVQVSYELISDSQQCSLDNSAKRLDATTTFFGACAGDNDNNMDSSDNMSNDRTTAMSQQQQPASSPPLSSPKRGSSSPGGPSLTLASSVFSNVISKMAIPKKQTSFSEFGKKFMHSTGNNSSGHGNKTSGSSSIMSPVGQPAKRILSTEDCFNYCLDYEVLINNEMLGLTVENVLERTIIRTLLPDGAAKHAGAQVGSLIAKVGNVDTSNLTHFETIDELRRSQRPLKLTLRHIGVDVLRRAREEMGRLIRGQGLASAANTTQGDVNNKPWKENSNNRSSSVVVGETFDSVLNNRWPSRSNKSLLVSGASVNAAPLAMTRSESMHQAGKNLIRILALMVVGLEKELNDVSSSSSIEDYQARPHSNLTVKELKEAIEITSKILLDYARSQPDVDDNKHSRSSGNKSPPGVNSSFYPVPPGRVQGKKQHGTPPNAGRGGGKGQQRGKKQSSNSPLLRIGDALQRTRSFLVESNSITATALRWEIIDYLCVVLDLDTEQELSEKESASPTEGGESSSPTNDLGAAGSILKLIVLNCSTISTFDAAADQQQDNSDSSVDSRSIAVDKSTSGNPFLSVVHRLAASKSTSARVSACSLGPVLWSHLDFPRQLQLRGVITRALHDVEVIVRKSTAAVLHEIAELVFDRRAVPWLVLMCERSMTDPEPQLRAAAMTLTWHLAEHLPNAFLGDASKGSRSLQRLPPRDSPAFMDVYLLQCKLLPVANNLAEDRIASVRLSVAAQCDRLCNAMGEHWFNIIIDLLQALLSDTDERVRSEAILCMPRLVESVIVGSSDSSNVTVLGSLLPLALKTQKDSSAMVRSSLAVATGELLIFLVGLGSGSSSSNEPSSPGGPPPSPSRSGNLSFAEHKKHVDDTLIPILQKLLQDSDPEVTTASLRAVTNASRSGTSRERIPSCSHSTHIDDDLVSLSSHHSHQSHTSIERTKPIFTPVLSEKQVLRLLPTLTNLATSTQWRVRQSAVEIVPALMGCTHRHETRHEISKLCLKLMNDKVDAVRKTAAECLCLGGSSLARHGVEDGGEWIRNIVIPHLRTCSQSEESKQRLLSLKMVEIIITNGLCPRAGVEAATSSPRSPDDDESTTSSIITESERPIRTILSIAASLTSDNVANVRLNVGRTFNAIIMLLDRADVDFAVETLEKQLKEETIRPGGGDRDVIYFASQAKSSAYGFFRMAST